MERIDVLPDDLEFVMNGQEHGETWTRFTDGEHDYEAVLHIETQVETFYRI